MFTEWELTRWHFPVISQVKKSHFRVRRRLENPWIFVVRFQGLESTWDRFLVLETSWLFTEQDLKITTLLIVLIFGEMSACTLSHKCTAQVHTQHVFSCSHFEKSLNCRVLESSWIFCLKKCTDPVIWISCRFLIEKVPSYVESDALTAKANWTFSQVLSLFSSTRPER